MDWASFPSTVPPLILTHLYLRSRLAEMSPYEIARPLSSTLGPYLFPSPTNTFLKRVPPSFRGEDWETAVKAAAAALEEARILGGEPNENGDGTNGNGNAKGGHQKRRASMIVQLATNRQLQELAARVVKDVEEEEDIEGLRVIVDGGEEMKDAETVGSEGQNVGTNMTETSMAQPQPQPQPPSPIPVQRRSSLPVPGFRTDFPTTQTSIVLPPSPTPRRLTSKRISVGMVEEEKEKEKEGDSSDPSVKNGDQQDEQVVMVRMSKKEVFESVFLCETCLSASAVVLWGFVEGFEDYFGSRSGAELGAGG